MEYNKMMKIVQEKDEEIKKLKLLLDKSQKNNDKDQIRELQDLNQMLDIQVKELKQ